VWSNSEYYPACGQFYGSPQFKEDGGFQAQRPAARIDGGEGSLIQINGFGLDYDVNVAGQTRIRE
jgi:hypothetical protein